MPGRGRPWREGGLVDDTVTSPDVKDNSIWGLDLSIFKSIEITGTGSEQDIAHGLGRTPTVVWWSISLQGTGNTVVPGIHDGINVKLNFPATTKLYVFAL